MVLKAVIFDLDGTLLDTIADLANAMNRVLAARNFPVHPVDSYRYFVGEGAEMLIRRALPPDRESPELVQECLKAFRAEYQENWNILTRPYQGIAELLDALTLKAVPMAVLSNKPHVMTTLCVENILAGWTFQVVFGQRAGVPRKPDPTSALEVATTLSVPPAEICYLGDTDIDMKTASSAGMFPVGALWGFRGKKELVDNGAGVTINHPLELLDVLKIKI